jgi:hypothetical protein
VNTHAKIITKTRQTAFSHDNVGWSWEAGGSQRTRDTPLSETPRQQKRVQVTWALTGFPSVRQNSWLSLEKRCRRARGRYSAHQGSCPTSPGWDRRQWGEAKGFPSKIRNHATSMQVLATAIN